MNKYSELLTDPRWQKKRLEALSEANFRCSQCGTTRRRLDVHHKKYRRGRQPWEYENHELEVLCRLCHELEHVELTDDERLLEKKIKDACDAVLKAPTREEKRSWLSAMKVLISSRTPELIRKLELMNGLAK